MTPEQELALLRATAAGLEEELQAAYRRMLELIESGVEPRDAVQAVMDGFQGAMAETMATALSGILQQSVGTAAVLQLEVGAVQLSRKLYAEGAKVSEVVAGVVDRHLRGFVDARKLALSLFEGYAFKPEAEEPLQFNRANPKLPQYMREALLPDLSTDFRRAYARIQVNGLRTPELRAAYSQLLEALNKIETTRGKRLLEKRLQVAFLERMRYFAQRIALTELHRSYNEREARIIKDDDVEFVQIRRAPGGAQDPCFCVLVTQRDRYGLGPGVYPKLRAPVPPFHPHCRCKMVPRTDMRGRTAKEEDPEADAYFLDRLGEQTAARVMGSRAKRDQVLAGTSAESVYNASIDPAYRVRQIADVAP